MTRIEIAKEDYGKPDALDRAIARARSRWQPIETAPKNRKLIVAYLNSLGNWRMVMATYYPAKTLDAADEAYDIADEDGYAPEGWYEECDNRDSVLPTDKPPTHWQPLPAPPVIQD